MENVSKMRTELSNVFEMLKKNELDIQQAKAIVATSNAMLKSAQLEMEHSKMLGSSKRIKFLETV